jgi:hypothetical protein
MYVLRHLEDVGVQIDNVATETSVGSSRLRADALIDVRVDDRPARFVVEERKRAPYPAEVDALAPLKGQLAGHGAPLLVAPFVSEGTGRRLVAAGWSWADDVGNFDLRAPGVRLRQRVATTAPDPTSSSLPRGSGSSSVIRWLIVHGDVTSLTQLALKSRVTQPRISQVLQRLERLALVNRSMRARWQPDRDALLDRFLKEYPGPGGSETFHYSLDPPLEVALRLASRRPGSSMAVSADVGADLLVPWRRPTHVVVYTEAPVNLQRALDATEALGRGDANVIHRVPDDRSVFALNTEIDVQGTRVPLADPVQLLWDLERLGGDDRGEAAEKLRQWLLTSR